MKSNNKKIVPAWILRLVGITSLATAVISFAVYWFKKSAHRQIKQNEQDQTTTEEEGGWSDKFLNGIKSTVRKNKKRMTISLKNTVLWNPSPDLDTPIYGFKENSIQLLTRLSYLYDIYIIIHVNSNEEKQSIDNLLDSNQVFKNLVDPRKRLYCSEEEGKIHIIRHIEPFVHIEGGWEKDDGEEIIKKLKPFISKIVWLVTRRRRDSIKQDKEFSSHHIEIADSLIDTSIANEVK